MKATGPVSVCLSSSCIPVCLSVCLSLDPSSLLGNPSRSPLCAAAAAAAASQVIDSIVWAFRHTERNVAETGLNLLLEMLVSFQKSEFATQFHQTYYMQLVQEIFAVMTGAGPACPFFSICGTSRKNSSAPLSSDETFPLLALVTSQKNTSSSFPE